MLLTFLLYFQMDNCQRVPSKIMHILQEEARTYNWHWWRSTTKETLLGKSVKYFSPLTCTAKGTLLGVSVPFAVLVCRGNNLMNFLTKVPFVVERHFDSYEWTKHYIVPFYSLSYISTRLIIDERLLLLKRRSLMEVKKFFCYNFYYHSDGELIQA